MSISTSLRSTGIPLGHRSKRSAPSKLKLSWKKSVLSNRPSQKCPKRWWGKSVKKVWFKTYKYLIRRNLKTETNFTKRGKSSDSRLSRVRWWRAAASSQLYSPRRRSPPCRLSRWSPGRKSSLTRHLRTNHLFPARFQILLWIMIVFLYQIKLLTSRLDLTYLYLGLSRIAWLCIASMRWRTFLRSRTTMNLTSQVSSTRAPSTFKMIRPIPCSISNSKVNTIVNINSRYWWKSPHQTGS